MSDDNSVLFYVVLLCLGIIGLLSHGMSSAWQRAFTVKYLRNAAGNHSFAFLQQDAFLQRHETRLLRDYFTSAIDRLRRNDTANHAYDGRVIYFSAVDDVQVRSFLAEIKYATARALRRLYNVTRIFSHSCHLVRWSPGHELGLHADNAFWPSGEPNYTPERTHSATVFLNDDYAGGEFYFHDGGRNYVVQPSEGRLVAFGGGMDYAHGVRRVVSGTRYMVAMWFTDQERMVEW